MLACYLLFVNFMPSKKVSRSLPKLKTKPWITKGILKLMKVKGKTYRKMYRTKKCKEKTRIKLNIYKL